MIRALPKFLENQVLSHSYFKIYQNSKLSVPFVPITSDFRTIETKDLMSAKAITLRLKFQTKTLASSKKV